MKALGVPHQPLHDLTLLDSEEGHLQKLRVNKFNKGGNKVKNQSTVGVDDDLP